MKTYIAILGLLIQSTHFIYGETPLRDLGVEWQSLKQTIDHKNKDLNAAQLTLETNTRLYQKMRKKMAALINDLRIHNAASVSFSVGLHDIENMTEKMIVLKRVRPLLAQQKKKILSKMVDFHKNHTYITDLKRQIGEFSKNIQNLETTIDKAVKETFSEDKDAQNALQKMLLETNPKTLPQLSKTLYTLSPGESDPNDILRLQNPVHGEFQALTRGINKPTPFVEFKNTTTGYILAPQSGKIVYVGDFEDKYTIAIQSKDKIIILQGCMDAYCCVGNAVEKGTPIAYRSLTEKSPTHLYMFKNGSSLDPLPHLNHPV